MRTLETTSRPASTHAPNVPADPAEEEVPSSIDPNRLGDRLIRILIPV